MSIYLIAQGSLRNWSNFEGRVSRYEADFIAKAGCYQMVSQRLEEAISASELDRLIDREFGGKTE